MGSRQLLVLGAALLLVAAAWLLRPSGDRAAPPRAVAPTDAARGAAAETSADPGPGDARAGAAAPDARQPPQPPPAAAGAADDGGDELGGDAIAAAWANVDLDEVRRALPDNLYWQMGVPTSDEQEIERRARERDRWNVEYGKVLSGTGSEEEIRAYYDQRARLSADYVEFSTYLLDHYGEVLPERDVALLKLSRRLHLARLEEIPRSVQQALQRKAEQDEARARWQAEERAFHGDDAAAPDGAPKIR